MFAHLNPHGSDFGDVCALYPTFLHQLIMHSSLFNLGAQSHVPAVMDATIKGPLEKGELFAVMEYMKGGQVVTHPCVSLQKIKW